MLAFQAMLKLPAKLIPKPIPGLLLLCTLALVSQFFSELIVIGGKHPLEASALAILIGILLRHLNFIPQSCSAGIKCSDTILVWGIVLLGAGLDFRTLMTQGSQILTIVLVTMTLSFFSILVFCHYLKLSSSLSMLLAAGSTICGTSAIAITAPLIKAPKQETSYAIATVSLLGLIATLLYPAIANLFNVSDLAFGVFAGAAIHSTPQVVGAGFIFSDLAGRTATAVKLLRNCFMAPIAILIAIFYRDSNTAQKLSRSEIMRAFPWFLFWFFILAALSSIGFFGITLLSYINVTAKFLVLLAMAAIGLNTDLSALKALGIKPIFAGVMASTLVAIIAIILINNLL